jgi:transposase InsO family protein
MITEEAKHRVRILAFWEKHGLDATKEAFGVGRATLFRWQKELRNTKGKLEGLNNKSTAPKKKRKREVPEGVEDYIIRERTPHPRLSKEKLAILMREDLGITLSFSKVGRIMRGMKKRDPLPLLKPQKKVSMVRRKVRRNGFAPQKPGDLLEIDTVVTNVNGVRNCTLTAIDLHGRFAHAGTSTSASSKTASDFLKDLRSLAPFPIERIQTDNGSGFAKHFASHLEEEGIIHFHTYPRSPKMNAHIERFNRTIQEERLNWHRQLLSVDLPAFNLKVDEWMRWYNQKRPHISLGYLSPLKYIEKHLPEKSHM